MQKRRRNTWEQLASGEVPWGFLLLGVGLALLAEAPIDAVEDMRHSWIVYVIAGVVCLAVGWSLAQPWWRKLFAPREWEMERFTGEDSRPARGVVVTASLGAGIHSARLAIEQHEGTLERVWILHTKTEAGTAAARECIKMAADVDPAIEPKAVALDPRSADDPEIAYRAIEDTVFTEVYDLGWSEDNVCLDYTGGTKAFTAAMTLAGAIPGRRLQYVAPVERDENGRPAEGTVFRVVEVDLRYEMKPDRTSRQSVPT